MKPTILKLFLFLALTGLLFSGCSSRSGLEGRWVGCDVRRPLIDWTLTIHGNRFYLVREDLTIW